MREPTTGNTNNTNDANGKKEAGQPESIFSVVMAFNEKQKNLCQILNYNRELKCFLQKDNE